MNRCEQVQAQLYQYLDRESTWYRRIRVRWHLRRCPPCGDGFRFEARFQAKVREGCVDDVPEELYERLRTFLSQNTDGTEA